MPASPGKILVIGPAWVGDMVMTQSLLMLLRSAHPQAVIDVVGPPWALPIVARMPEARRGVVLAVAHGEVALGARRRLGLELRREGYDQAIVLPRSFKSALVPYFARIPRRTGYATEMRRLVLNDLRPLDRARLDQTVKRLIALGLPPAAPLPAAPPPRLRIDAANRAALASRLGLGRAPAVALLPGAAYGPAKQWPLESFAELARRLAARGEEIWVFGSAAERELGVRVSAAAGGAVRNLCGETGLGDVVDLLSLARAAVTNDSGLMHVAAAAGTRVVAIYGSSSPEFTPPLTTQRAIHCLRLDCSPCFERECPLGHLRCLRDITVDEVLASLDEVPVARATVHGSPL
jgi:heptosyltransferase-2